MTTASGRGGVGDPRVSGEQQVWRSGAAGLPPPLQLCELGRYSASLGLALLTFTGLLWCLCVLAPPSGGSDGGSAAGGSGAAAPPAAGQPGQALWELQGLTLSPDSSHSSLLLLLLLSCLLGGPWNGESRQGLSPFAHRP